MADATNPKEKVDKKQVRKKVDSELEKVVTVLRAGEPFASVTTFEGFLVEAEKMFKAYKIPFDKKMFKEIKKVDTYGNNKKTK